MVVASDPSFVCVFSGVSVVFEIESLSFLCCSDSDCRPQVGVLAAMSSSEEFKSPFKPGLSVVQALVVLVLGSGGGVVCSVCLVRMLELRLPSFTSSGFSFLLLPLLS